MMNKKIFFLLFAFILSISLISALRNAELYQCKNECNVDFKLSVQECNLDYNECKLDCNDSSCRKVCSSERNICKKEARAEQKMCKNSCMLGNFSLTQDLCLSGGGNYQQLCNGNYFDLRCSVAYYCVCDGDLDYTCPLNYSCVKNFTVKNIPTIETSWKSSTGQPIGDIGICKKD